MSSFGSRSSRGSVVPPPPTALTPAPGVGAALDGRHVSMTGSNSLLTTTKTSLSSSPTSGRGGTMPPLQQQQLQQQPQDGGGRRGGGLVMEQRSLIGTLEYRGRRSNGSHHSKNRQHDSKKKQSTSKSSSLSRPRRKPGSRQQPQQQPSLEKPSPLTRQRSAPSTSMEAIVASLNRPSRESMPENRLAPTAYLRSQNRTAGGKGEGFSHHVRHWSLGDGAPLGQEDDLPVTNNGDGLASNQQQRQRTSSADRVILGRNRTLLDDDDDFFLSEPSVSSNGASEEDELAGDSLEASSDDEDKQQNQQRTYSPPPPPTSPSPSVLSGNVSPGNTSLSSKDLSSPGRIANGQRIRIQFGSDASSDGGGGAGSGHGSPHQFWSSGGSGQGLSGKGIGLSAARALGGPAPQLPLGRQISSLTATSDVPGGGSDNHNDSRHCQNKSAACSNAEKTPKMANDVATRRKTSLDGPIPMADLDELEKSNDNTEEGTEKQQPDADKEPIHRGTSKEGDKLAANDTNGTSRSESHGRDDDKEPVASEQKRGGGSKDDGQSSADDEKTYQRPRRKRISGASPAHRRTRSGDDAAASLLTGRNDWAGMEMDELPMPANEADVVDDEQDDEVPQLDSAKFSVGAGPTLRSPRLSSGRRRLRRRSDVHLQSTPQHQDHGPHAFFPVTPTVRFGVVPRVVKTLDRLDSVSTLGGGEGELSGSRRSFVSEDGGGTILSQRLQFDREEKNRGLSAASGGSSNDSQGSKSVFSWISSRMSMVSRPKALSASSRRVSAPVTVKELMRRGGNGDHASSEEESSLHLSDDDTEVDKEQADRGGSGPDPEAPSPADDKRLRAEQEKQEEEKMRRLEAFEMHVRSLADLGRDPSFHRPAIAVSDEEAMKYPTFICPNCNTRQREFFSVNSAPREFESPAGYLALYFGIYVVAALFIFGLQEGWAPLDCVYFSVITLTTAGLGDFVPKTDSAKVICSIFIYFGVACIGLLLGSLLASGLDDASRKAAKENQVKNCPNCAQLKSQNNNRAYHAAYAQREDLFPPPPPPQQPSPMYPNRMPSNSWAQSSKGEEESSFDETCAVSSSNLPRPSLAKRHKSDQGYGRDRGWSQFSDYSTSQSSGGGSRARGDSAVSRRSFQRTGSGVGTEGLAPVDEEGEAATVSSNQAPAPRDGWSAGNGVVQQEEHQEEQTQAAATQPDQVTIAASHKRHFSLDCRTLGVTEATPPECNRVRNFSVEVGAISTGNSKATPSVIGFPNSNGGWGSVAPGATPQLYSDFDDEISEYSSSSAEDDDPLKPSGRIKAAKYVFLTLRQALANSIFIIAIGGFGFYFIEQMRAVDAFYFTTVLLTTVGYGDIVPHTPEGKMFATVYVLVAGTVLLHNMSLISMIPLELRKRRIEQAVLMQFGDQLDDVALRELATGPLVQRLQLRATRADGLDECTREMFALAMLVRLGRVSEQDVLATFAAFRRLDVDDDGKLNSKDIVMGEVERRRTRLRKARHEARRQDQASVGTDATSVLESIFGWGKRSLNVPSRPSGQEAPSGRLHDGQEDAVPSDHMEAEEPLQNDGHEQSEDPHHAESEHSALLSHVYHVDGGAVDPRATMTSAPEAQHPRLPIHNPYVAPPYYPYGGQYMSFVQGNDIAAAGMDSFTSLNSFLETNNSVGVDYNDAPPAIRTRGMSSESSFSGMTASTAGEDANDVEGGYPSEEFHGIYPGHTLGIQTGMLPPPPPPPPPLAPPMSPTPHPYVSPHPHVSPQHYPLYQAPTYLQLSPQQRRPAPLRRPQHGRVQSFAGFYGGGQVPFAGVANDQYRSRFWSSEAAARESQLPAYE